MVSNLKKTTKTKAKRLGRGYGSGKGGHTASRGQKGQKSRGGVGILFEGTKMRKSLLKRMPFLPGKGKMKGAEKPIIVNLKYLNVLPENTQVDIKNLVKHNIVGKQALKYGVKILGDGEITRKLIIKTPISLKAAQKIKKAGGEVQV